MKLSKKERHKLICRVSKASGIAQYALEAKLTDESLIEADRNLKILVLLKDANNYNRYCQAQKTAEANAKLKQFLDPKNSEIYKTGFWLMNAISRVGQDRKQSLLEKDLVHKSDYNNAVADLKDTIKEQQQGITQLTFEAQAKISALEERIDSLREQLKLIQSYITKNQGLSEWRNIAKFVQHEKR